MKKIIYIILIIFLSSCTKKIYQVIETSSSDVAESENSYIFENDNLKVSYNFWGEAGHMYFTVFNKTEKPIFIDLNRCHLIVNQRSYNYYSTDEKIETTFFATTDKKVKQGSEVSYKTKMQQIYEIPPQSYVIINQLLIMDSKFDFCELKKVTGKNFPFLIYTQKSSPFQFRNFITYDFKPDFSTFEVVDNTFWVSKVTNMNKKAFKGEKSKEKVCPDDLWKKIIYQQPFYKPENFYFIYEKDVIF
ncbi:MAG: hypothetical protein DRJ01_02035 [Bacteroidetes bacterium]|nr:MAG: hypothetical protein DRJ01_02035 [Bacteroidota bacterium]